MSCPRYDFHIHTKYLKCANETMEVPAILAECARLGLAAIGITDHINRFEQIEQHAAILEDLRAAETRLAVYFGAELNFTGCDGDFAFDEQIKERYGFQFAIGGIHSCYLEERDLGKLIDIQHRHHLRVCRDPLCDVLVHPYWIGRSDIEDPTWPQFESVRHVPPAYTRELGQTARQTGTAIEINAQANLVGMPGVFGQDYVKYYVEYLSILAEQGPMFSIASDAHDLGELQSVRLAWGVAEQIGLGPERIWRPHATPVFQSR